MNKRLILSLLSSTFYGMIMLAISLIGKDVSFSYRLTILGLSVVIGHTLIGFVAGISNLGMNRWLHGITIGCAVQMTRSFTVYVNNFSMPYLFFTSLVLNGIFCGLFVEWINYIFADKS